jgi:hypothetical protein
MQRGSDLGAADKHGADQRADVGVEGTGRGKALWGVCWALAPGPSLAWSPQYTGEEASDNPIDERVRQNV